MPSASTKPFPTSITSVKCRTSSRRRSPTARSRNRFEVSFASPTGPAPSLSRAARASFFDVCGRRLVEESPAHRIVRPRQVALGEDDLEEMRVAHRRAEHLGAAVDVDAPDATEALVELLRVEGVDLLPVAVEALAPGVERQRVVAAQVLDVHHLQAGALHGGDGMRETRDPAAREDVAADEELGLEVPDVADEVQHAEAAGLQELRVRLHHLLELVAPGVLEGADGHHLVVLARGVAKVGVDHPERGAKAAPLDLLAHHLDLRGGVVDAGDVDPEALVRVEHEAAEARADIDHLLTRLQPDPARDMLDLVPLRLLQRARALLPVRAGVHHERVVEPVAVELGAQG